MRLHFTRELIYYTINDIGFFSVLLLRSGENHAGPEGVGGDELNGCERPRLLHRGGPREREESGV